MDRVRTLFRMESANFSPSCRQEETETCWGSELYSHSSGRLLVASNCYYITILLNWPAVKVGGVWRRPGWVSWLPGTQLSLPGLRNEKKITFKSTHTDIYCVPWHQSYKIMLLICVTSQTSRGFGTLSTATEPTLWQRYGNNTPHVDTVVLVAQR